MQGGIRYLIKRLRIPVTIILIPHNQSSPIRINLPLFILFLFIFFLFLGIIGMFFNALKTAEYERIKKERDLLSSTFWELKSTMASLKKAEGELSRLLSFKTREEILSKFDEDPNPGSLNLEVLKKETEEAIERISGIREFLKEQKHLYLATPQGWPVEGRITSDFGKRLHPVTGNLSFHSGVDIEVAPGTPVKATAEGVVSFSGWNYESGYSIVIEHGYGYSTVYAHNRKNFVVVGQRVKKGEVIGISGGTGSTTGPHLHYEIWKDRRPVDPKPFLEKRFVEKGKTP